MYDLNRRSGQGTASKPGFNSPAGGGFRASSTQYGPLRRLVGVGGEDQAL